MSILRSKKIEIAVAVFILLFSIGLRVNAPNADLPSNLTFSGSILTDEGNQCHNSRSKVLFNEWFPDDWRITNYNPVLPWIKYSIFKLFGVGLWQLRLVNYIFAALSLLFFFFTLKSYFRENFKFALVGTLLLGINFLYVMYNKIGTFETSIIFWMILTMYFLEKFRAQKRGVFLFLAGASTSMTFIFKTITAYVFPIPFIAYILIYLVNPKDGGEEKISLKQAGVHILYILFGVLALIVPWYWLHYLPNREWIISSPGQFMGNLIFPKSIKMAFNNFLNFPWREQFYKIPVVWLGAVLYIPLFLRRLIRREVHLTEIAYTFYFLAHTVVFFIMTYRPTRYLIPVIPAMVFLTAMLFERWVTTITSNNEAKSYPRLIKPVIFIADTIWLSLAAYFCLIPLVNRYLISVSRPGLSVYYFIASAIVIALTYRVRDLYCKHVGKTIIKYSAVSLVALLVLVSLVVNLGYYLSWYNDRAYTIYNMSKEWGEKLDHAYIAGMTAAASVLGTNHRTLWLYPNFVNWDEHTFDRYPVSHALLGADISVEIIHHFNQWPERMSHAKLAKVYHIKDYFLHFYSFVDPYINSCAKSEDGFEFNIINPSKKDITCKIGRIYFTKSTIDGKDVSNSSYTVLPGQEAYQLKPGENKIDAFNGDSPGSEADSVLFYLDYTDPFAGKPLRYEGEIFARRTGSNYKISNASNHFVRFFNREKDKPGFMAYGPKVPFARGFLIADFKLDFSNLKTALLPLCRLEIFAPLEKEILAELSVKPSDSRKNQSHTYRLHTLLPATRTLEFRIDAGKLADIAFDYMDLTYYQGFYLSLH